MEPNVEFDPNSWDYDDPHAIARVSAFVASSVGDPQISDRLLDAWKTGGGKALGLLLCEHIARGMGVILGESGPHIAVPPWWSETTFDRATIDRVRRAAMDAGWWQCILRSSQPYEDWRDARSGVLGSHLVIVSGRWPDPTEYAYVAEKIGVPYIVQQDVDGIGCVIDVGWSALLEQPVVRLAVGNPFYADGETLTRPQAFSSATWDQESMMALFDTDGRVLVPLTAPVPFGAIEEGLRDRFHAIMARAVPALIATLRSLGLTFGAQLEVVVDIWQTPPCIHVVQVRPSPGTIRGFVGTPDRQGDLVARTLKVSRAGVATGLIVVLTNLDRATGGAIAVGQETPVDRSLYHVALGMKIGREKYITEALEEPVLQELRRAVSERIVLWKTAGSDYELPLHLVTAVQGLGPAGQVYWKSLFPNSHHGVPGVMDYGMHYQQACANAVQRGGVMASDIGHEQYARLLERAERESLLVIQIVSDGLVGEVRTR